MSPKYEPNEEKEFGQTPRVRDSGYTELGRIPIKIGLYKAGLRILGQGFLMERVQKHQSKDWLSGKAGVSGE